MARRHPGCLEKVRARRSEIIRRTCALNNFSKYNFHVNT